MKIMDIKFRFMKKLSTIMNVTPHTFAGVNLNLEFVLCNARMLADF